MTRSGGKRILPLLLFSGLTVVSLAGLPLVPSIPQDQSYHQFADARTIFGIPNFWNVVSNLPFLAVAVLGLAALSSPSASGSVDSLRGVYATFFLGSALIALGSSYYHLRPSYATLVWDRLPMTVGFMSFFALVL